MCNANVPLSRVIGTVVNSKPPLQTALVETSFSSVGRAVAYNARGSGVESQRGLCIFRR
jgi:hypothetical protein